MSLVAESVFHRYGKATDAALNGVDMEAPQGSLTALVGPNGSGKSTLLRCLAGAIRPQKGMVVLDGQALQALGTRRLAQRLAYVPQETPTPFAFTVDELVGLAPGSGVTSATAEEAIDTLDLKPLRHRSLTTLSGGERQRAAIARGLAQANVQYVLLDEPTAHLDIRHQVRLFDLLQRRARAGAGVLVVVHEIELAARWADRVILLNRGTTVGAGTVEEMLTGERLSQIYQTPVTIEVLTSGIAIYATIPRINSDDSIVPKLSKSQVDLADDLISP